MSDTDGTEPDGLAPRWALKRMTDLTHSTLDERLSALDLADEGDYRTFLRIHARALLPIERALEDAGIAQTDLEWPRRARGSSLTADLRGMSTDVPPPLAIEPIPSDHASLLGVLYVLEGSRLGGALLARRAMQGGDRVRDNMRFLSHGTGQRLWPSFLHHLDALGTQGNLDRAGTTARMTFALFDRAVSVETGTQAVPTA